MWTDIAGIVFACVTANHLGLVKAIETVTKCNRLPIIGCVKCCTFWSVLLYMVVNGHGIIQTLAIPFIASYAAIWLELFEGIIDLIYMRLYETITTNNDYAASAGTGVGNTDCSVSELRQAGDT